MAARLWCYTRVQGFESGGRVVIEVVGKLVQAWNAPYRR